MNKIHLSIVVIGGMLLFFIAIVSGYFLAKKPSTLTNHTPVEEKFDSSLGVVPTMTVPDNQSSEPVLVKTVTINAKTAKTLTESNNRTGTYLNQLLLLSSGELAYIIKHGLSTSLFLNDTKIADNVFILDEMVGKLMYISNDIPLTQHSLFWGEGMLATAPVTSLTDTFDVTEIDGKLAYTVYDNVKKQKTLFYDGKPIAIGQNIKDIQKTSQGISYVSRNYDSNVDTLFYNGQAVATAYEIPDYVEEDNGELAYTTFTFVDKTPPKNEGYFGEDYPTVTTLFENGKKIISADLIKIKKISGKLAYIANPTGTGKSQLYYKGKVVQSADHIDHLSEIAGEPAYTATDYEAKELRFFVGDRLIAKTKMDGSIQFKEIAGKLAYSVSDTSAREYSVFYNGQELPQGTSFYSLQEVNGKLVYTVVEPSQKGTLYYDNQKVAGDYDIQGIVKSRSDSGIVYFTISKETGSSTAVSIYKLDLR